MFAELAVDYGVLCGAGEGLGEEGEEDGDDDDDFEGFAEDDEEDWCFFFVLVVGLKLNGKGWDGMGWNGMEWDGMGWDGMGWNGMGWDGMELMVDSYLAQRTDRRS